MGGEFISTSINKPPNPRIRDKKKAKSKKMLKVKKILSIVTIITLLFLRVGPSFAQEAPTAPEAPTSPEAPLPEQTAPTPPPEPTPPPAPTLDDSTNEVDESAWDEEDEDTEVNTSSSGTTSSSSSGSQTDFGQQSGNQTSDGQVGTTEVNTGDATNTAGVSTIANTNTSAGIAGSGSGSISVLNSENGSNSSNSGSVGVINNNDTIQNNSAIVSNDLDQTSNSGNNSASQNVGDSSITTGDANTSGTVIIAVNTNIDGVGVAEFSVLDDHIGDIILDFSSGCIYGCVSGDLESVNSGNGTGSTNDASVDQTTNNNTTQNNDAVITSNLDLSSISGGNIADDNTNGDSLIETGDANVAGNALTFANNNLSGGVYFNFVYIYGDLIGDIILPEDYFTNAPCPTCSSSDLLAKNSGNGSDTTNTASIDQTTGSNTFQTNDADIENNMLLSANTGSNTTSSNTGGDSSITTGDTNIDGQVLNIANSNVSGGDWWLLLINEAGNWIGKILGAPSGGGTYAGSDGTEFLIDENGIITAVNSGNGSSSTNDASVSDTTNNTTVQTNDAKIVNNLNLSANTGGNSASNNTGGNSEIKTGDANIIASIVNMVNNNFAGGGRLFVTVVDVFGSWLGDFIAPGYKKSTSQAITQNDQNQQGAISSSNSSSGGSSNGSVSNNSQNPSSTSSTTNSNQQTSNNTSPKSNASGTSIVQVASFQESSMSNDTESISQGTIVGKSKIKINLAWLLLATPVLLLAYFRLKKFRQNRVND